MKTSHDSQKEKYTSNELDGFFIERKEKRDKELKNITEEVQKTKDKVEQALNKHQEDNVVIHSRNKFKKTDGPKTDHAKTVTYKGSTGNGTRFVEKSQSHEETVTEVTAGTFYTELLSNRSPVFRLVEGYKGEDDPLKVKSKLLDNFVTLGDYVEKKKREKLLDLIYEKFADEDGRKELTAYMATSLNNIEELRKAIECCRKNMQEYEEFFANILTQFSDDIIIEHLNKEYDTGKLAKERYDILKEHPEYTKLEGFLELENLLVQIFKKFKGKRECIENLLLNRLYLNILTISERKMDLLRLMNSDDKAWQNKGFIEERKNKINELTPFYKSFATIVNRLDKEEFNKKLLVEIIEEIKKAEGIEDQLISHANQELNNEEVRGLEKIVTSMLLLGCGDLHANNIGMMDVHETRDFSKPKHKHRDASKTTKKVYGKVDMSASFLNLGYTNYLHYISLFKHIMLDCSVVQGSNVKWYTAIDYSKLKKKINKACDLFIDNTDYVESLIHRALFYNKPLLRAERELDLVTDLAEAIIKQAKLLKKFANSEEFTHLTEHLKEYIASGYDDYTAWAKDHNKKIHGEELKPDELHYWNASLIERLTKAVKDNLRYNPLQNKPKTNLSQMEEQIKNMLPRFQKQCSLLSYESKRGIVKLSEENISTIDGYTRSSGMPSNLFFDRINLIHAWILTELNGLNTYTFQEYNEEKLKIVKEYLQVIEKYLECTSKILNKFGKLSDEEKSQGEGLVAQKLIVIEKILNPKIQEQEAPLKPDLNSVAEEAPSSTAEVPEPEAKLPDDVISLDGTDEETTQSVTEDSGQPQQKPVVQEAQQEQEKQPQKSPEEALQHEKPEIKSPKHKINQDLDSAPDNEILGSIRGLFNETEQSKAPIKEKKQQEPEVKKPQHKPVVEVEGTSSPTIKPHVENPKHEEGLPDDVISLDGADEKTDTQSITKNGEQLQPEATTLPSPTVDKEDPKHKSNSKYSYIGVCATAGLCIGFAIGCVTAYFLGAASLAPMIAITVLAAAAVVGMLVGAAFGAGIGYCVSGCFDNPNVEEHKQLFVSS